MSEPYVVDTHALFWYLIDSPRLSELGRKVFQRAMAEEVTLILSPIVLLELFGLARNVKAPFDFATELALLERPPFRIEPITVADLRLRKLEPCWVANDVRCRTDPPTQTLSSCFRGFVS